MVAPLPGGDGDLRAADPGRLLRGRQAAGATGGGRGQREHVPAGILRVGAEAAAAAVPALSVGAAVPHGGPLACAVRGAAAARARGREGGLGARGRRALHRRLTTSVNRGLGVLFIMLRQVACRNVLSYY
eukprot:1181728-Prorocentrum_minimum.AAC.2